METVLSDTQGAKLAFFRQARAAGYALIVVFIRIGSSSLSLGRVLQRVGHGGHNVPPSKVRERFPRTQANAAVALRLADIGFVFDNSSNTEPYRHVETWQRGKLIHQAAQA